MSTAVVFDGKKFSQTKQEKIIQKLKESSGRPKLTAILVGDNQEARLYLKLKQKKAFLLGIDFEFVEFKGDEPEKIIKFIDLKNTDPANHGIIIELPLPAELKKSDWQEKILESIDPRVDVDCLTKTNLELLKEAKPRYFPPTVKAVIEIILLAVGVEKLSQIKDKKICVVGDRGMVGGPLFLILKNAGLEVSGVNTGTADLSLVTRASDILISTTGVGHIIKEEMVKPGAIVIDVGIEKQVDGRLLGDVDFESVKKKASFITPVPGGVGPLTIICLMENLLQSMYH